MRSVLLADAGPVVPGKGPIRTGVTEILARAKGDWDFVMAARSIRTATLAAETMTGADGLRATALPGNRLFEVLRQYKRIP